VALVVVRLEDGRIRQVAAVLPIKVMQEQQQTLTKADLVVVEQVEQLPLLQLSMVLLVAMV
jgi:hypothetical protein